ncbi:hypothetical protein ACP4OV_023105 [Aristida adscensionis]
MHGPNFQLLRTLSAALSRLEPWQHGSELRRGAPLRAPVGGGQLIDGLLRGRAGRECRQVVNPAIEYKSSGNHIPFFSVNHGYLEHATTPDELTMHDLVHDLARKILDKELIVLDASEQILSSGFEQHYNRHMRLVNYQKQSKALKEVPSKIRSLHFTECHALQLQQKPFSKCKYLRVLDLSGCSIEGKPTPSNTLLPCYIPQLILLRYLDASGLPITALPKSLSKLQKMQTLILSDCTIETLPDDIGSLLNLGYLDLSGNSNLNKLPASIGKLSVLSFLKLSGCSKLEELSEPIHQLESLRHLDTSGCCALQKLPDMFGSLPKLQFLNLSGCSKLVKLPENLNLESLEHLNLSSCHELHNLPQEFGSLDKLVFLNLSDCYKIQALPDSFCRLKRLKDLDLSDCHDLRELPACFGSLSELQYLNLTSCSKLQSLPDSFCDLCWTLVLAGISVTCHLPDSIGSMTSLSQLKTNAHNHDMAIYKVDIFMRQLNLPVSTIHRVQETDSKDCSIMELGKSVYQDLIVTNLKDVKCPEDAQRAKLRDFPGLQQLTLDFEDKYGAFLFLLDAEADAGNAQLVLDNLVPPRTIEEFALLRYRSKKFPDWMLDISSYLPYLVSIQLRDLPGCDSLPPLGQLPNLRLLHLWRLPSIRRIRKEFYGKEGTCKKLRVILLDSLENLDEWWTTRSGGEDGEFLIPNLHQLWVYNCPKSKFLPCPPKSMYWNLWDSDEVLPEHGFGRISSSVLPFHAAISSRDFPVATWARLQYLAPTLEILDVRSYDRSMRTLPEVTPCFPSLRSLHLSLRGLEILPEWLGKLVSLEELHIEDSPKLTSLPESLPNLTALKKLVIEDCPGLIERCRGEDAHKISHIPEVILED